MCFKKSKENTEIVIFSNANIISEIIEQPEALMRKGKNLFCLLMKQFLHGIIT